MEKDIHIEKMVRLFRFEFLAFLVLIGSYFFAMLFIGHAWDNYFEIVLFLYIIILVIDYTVLRPWNTPYPDNRTDS